MITEIVRYRLEPDEVEPFVAAYARAQAQLRLQPTCLGWELLRCDDEPVCFVLLIRWSSAQGHLGDFREGPRFPPFLAEIRPWVGRIEEMRHYTAVPEVGSAQSVYEAAGGAPAFEALAEAMHRAMVGDELLGSWFQGADPAHVPHLARWLGQVFGGPPAYTDELSDISLILRKHARLDIPEDKRARFVQISAAAAAAQWPDRPDVVRAIERYVEWGSQVAVENSRPGHVPDASAGVPTWTWGD